MSTVFNSMLVLQKFAGDESEAWTGCKAYQDSGVKGVRKAT